MGNRKIDLIKIGILLIIIFIIMIAIIFVNKRNKFDDNIEFYLIGEADITIYKDSLYEEKGFVARQKNGIDLTDKVKINGIVNTKINGNYIISYILFDDNGNAKRLERKIAVVYKDEFSLNGEAEIYMLLNGKYKELGAKCYENNVDYTSKIKIDSDLDTSKSGTYEIKYKVEEINKIITRTVYVSDFSKYFEITYSNTITNKPFNISITADLTKVFKYVLPDDTESSLNNNEFMIKSNGNYNFVIYDYYGNNISKNININNIEQTLPTVSCHAKISLNKTNVVVTSNKKIVKYLYNGIESTNGNYTMKGQISNVKVTIYDEAGNTNTATCASEFYSENMEIHFIASGHYDDAILIRTDNKVILIDSGRYNCATKVIPYLQQLGIKTIDAMIGSHIHNDHVAAQAKVLDNFNVSKVYYADDIFKCASKETCKEFDQEYIVSALKRHNKIPDIVKPETVITVGEMKLYFLGPTKLTSSQNDNSLVFILKFRNNSFMFTGDAGESVLNVTTFNQYASKMGIPLKVDMLKYPHHGNGSLNETFLNAIKPKYVVVPNYLAGKYPSSNDMNRLTKIGAKVYRQSDAGNILLISDGNNISFVTNVNPANYKR